MTAEIIRCAIGFGIGLTGGVLYGLLRHRRRYR